VQTGGKSPIVFSALKGLNQIDCSYTQEWLRYQLRLLNYDPIDFFVCPVPKGREKINLHPSGMGQIN
jgi:hypothetical protein